MAGAGYKLFQTGDVLTAAQVNTYLNEQTVMVFANAAARTSALTSVLAEGMVSYLQDTNAVEVYNGTAWVGVSGAGDVTEVQAGVGISVASGTGPIPVITNSSTDLITTAGDLLYGTAADTVARLGIGTAGQVLKVNSGATAPEWGSAAAGTPTYRGVGVYLTSTISIPNNAWTAVGWTNEHFDSDAYHDNSTNNSRLTIPAGYAGKYLISGNTNWDAYSAASIRGVQIYKNGVGGIIPVVVQPITNGTNGTNTSFAYVIDLAVSDYIEIYVYQNTGGNANLTGGTGNSAIQLSLLGA
jgi:hypothetical protein